MTSESPVSLLQALVESGDVFLTRQTLWTYPHQNPQQAVLVAREMRDFLLPILHTPKYGTHTPCYSCGERRKRPDKYEILVCGCEVEEIFPQGQHEPSQQELPLEEQAPQEVAPPERRNNL